MALLAQGYSFIAGLDEAGRGCLAGPVVAAAVILPLGQDCTSLFAGTRDSKQLTPQERSQLYEIIMQHALAVSVGIGSVELIDECNILQATKFAMRLALAQLSPSHEQYPAYGFAQHKGYGTEAHLAALRKHGAAPVHRRSFAPVRELFGLFDTMDSSDSPATP